MEDRASQPELCTQFRRGSDGGSGHAGIAVMVTIGTFWALAPRFGLRISVQSVDFGLAILVTFVVAGLTLFWSARRSLLGSELEECEEPASTASKASRSATPAKRSKVEAETLQGQEEELDPIWSADWTNAEERGAVAKQLFEASGPRPAEVFELNDTPTWLARLQQRRDQAQRAGKVKLAQKIEKEIAEATRSQAITAPRGAEARANFGQDHSRNKDLPEDDDIWDMDWSNWSTRESALPTVAAA
eukprot:gb/GFBE01033842.1/.p1 GENE.gb/GFBE01033842.1/~~gb/GFBE01033842.1/.p1  ORF type:complete len:246 (+),score=60.00 gb/GFBE01033842.1/:1-738(+)